VTLSLRQRIFLTLLPLVMLLTVLGSAGVVLLLRLGSRIDVILRDNYDSVLYMERLGEALERIDSSFSFALADEPELGKDQYDRQWQEYRKYLAKEQANITLPGEQKLVDRLNALTDDYRQQGDAFWRLKDRAARHRAYFGKEDSSSRLYPLFKEIKTTSGKILKLNQDNMEEASAEARATAASSAAWLSAGVAVALLLAGLLAWRMVRDVLRPIHAVTEAARGIAAGDLDQVVPQLAGGELGDLSAAFNAMARRLRDYRRSQVSRLLRAQQAGQAAIDSFPDPVFVLDTTGAVEMANPAAHRLLGVMPRQTSEVSKTSEVADKWQPPEPLRQPLADALAGRRHFLPDGFDHALLLGVGAAQRTLLPRILTIRDSHGDLLGAAVVLQDITPLRLLDEVKSNLVATVSHELKTPLTGVRLAIHLLLEEVAGPLTPKQTELLIDARENSERLLNMVENLLNLARLEQGSRQLDLCSMSPQTLLQDAADAIRPRAQDKGVEVALEVPPNLPQVSADAARLGTALGNLLDNALSYTDRGGRITLSASAAPGTVTLAIADTGLGIPPEHLPHVFEKFFRVPGQSRAGGTGLGLAIVHEVVIAHGGMITCESAPGQGTVFRIVLPTESPLAV
jgi:NtrC-family two-component system sensor histidine kinase KinB